MQLEDHQVLLGTIKASRFVKPFEADVDKWERILSTVTEVIEMMLNVQRQWMYLEVCLLLSITFKLACLVLLSLKQFKNNDTKCKLYKTNNLKDKQYSSV